MTKPDEPVPPLARLPSGISGLDEILHGGFLEGGVYILQGSPGAGKTVLANEICFRHARGGGRAAYVTLLAEMHTRLLQHLRPMAFFDESVIPQSLYYVSAFHTLEGDGLKGLLDVLRREIKGQRADLLVVDGLVAAQESAPSDREFKKFINELQAHASVSGCTVLLLTSGLLRQVSAEHTMVDGVFELEDQLFEFRTERSLMVRKFRGSGFLRGRHSFRITDAGVTFFPRVEAVFATASQPDTLSDAKISVGVPGIDKMLLGGLPAATTTGLIGASGIGKTTLGLHFLSHASAAEPGLLFGFFETPERLRLKARHLGLQMGAAVDRGDVEILWQPQRENVLDELAHRLIGAVRRRKVKRLFIDGLGGFLESATSPQRVSRFFSCLTNELRALGATTIFTMEVPEITGPVTRVPSSGVSALLENLVFLRFVERGSILTRLISVHKVRDSGHDPSLREFYITDNGIHVGEAFAGVEGLTTGVAREPASAAATPPPAGPNV
ncbi:MAG: AAA family ATPase [Proteobacteria bacterium]|nr:AAA family ATPase [Pseudomonadota bacterium]